MALRQPVEQTLDLLAAQQFVGMLLDHFRQMRGQHRSLIDYGVAGSQRLILQRGRNPQRGHAEGRLFGRSARQRARRALGTDGHQMVLVHLPAGHLDSAQRDDILARLEAHVVGDVHGRHDEAQLLGQILPQRLHPGQQLPALILVDQGHQAVAHFQAEFVQLQQIFDRVFFLALFPASCRRQRTAAAEGDRLRSAERARPDKPVPAASRKKETLGSPGMAARANITPEAINSGRRRDKSWRPTSTESDGVGSGAGHHHASGHRNQQARGSW